GIITRATTIMMTDTIMARRSRSIPLVRSAGRKRSPRLSRERPMSRPSAPPHPTPLPAGEREQAATGQGALYRLMAWLSPAYPVGAFSYSGGLEWAVEAGDVTNADALRHWLSVVIADGGGFCDAVFFAHAHRAVATDDDKALRELAELASVFTPSKERQLETTAQGHAFIEATRAAWPCVALERLMTAWKGPIHYPVAVAAAGHGIPREIALPAYLQAIVANLVSAGVRLIPLGQTDGQRVLAALEPTVATTVMHALATPLEEVGSGAFRADLASMRH